MYSINKKSDFYSLFMIRDKIENVKTKRLYYNPS